MLLSVVVTTTAAYPSIVFNIQYAYDRIGEVIERTGRMSEESPEGGSAEWFARALVGAAPEAIVVTDPEGTVRLWNAGAEAMFGFPASEAIGRSLDLIIPEKQRAAHWKGYEKAMATGVTKYGDTLLAVPALHRDGHRLSIEFSVALLRDETGAIVGISAIMREISKRRAAERALRARLAELEQRADPAPIH